MKKINFLFGVHCHQPVGNFEGIFEEAFEKAYRPFVDLIEKYPNLKVTLHYSGVLLEWFAAQRPDFIPRLKKLVERGQVEMMTGGFYEPIIPIIPDQDKLGQIRKQTEFTEKYFGSCPRGFWLTERIWEPHLPKSLSQAGVEYIAVDDYHFLSAGVSEDEMYGYYLTEEQGVALKIFPISKILRYLIPFKLPHETIEYLRSLATEEGNRAAILADDGEKFGVWPGTHKWVYEEKYLENLCTALTENKSWIESLTFSEYLDRYPASGRIYLPTASYTEMMEWALPVRSGLKYKELCKEIREGGRLEECKQFFKGGFFRNFFVKYEEANQMHKKMLYVSDKIAQAGKPVEQAQNELWKGQCNCAYWHGVFGGLYLNYLRHAVYEHLISAENLLDKALGRSNFLKTQVFDLDKDGKDEILVESDLLNLYFAPGYGGSLFELDYKPKRFNLLNTLARREEVYHKEIRETRPEEQALIPPGGTPSIHDLVRVKEKGLEAHLNYDWYRRLSLLDHFLGPGTTLEKFSQAAYEEVGDFVRGTYAFKIDGMKIVLWREGFVSGGRVKVQKTVLLSKGETNFEVWYELENLSLKDLELWFGVEFNFSLLAGEAPDRYYEVQGTVLSDRRLKSIGEVVEAGKVSLVDSYHKFIVSLMLEKPATLWRFPVETVSQSEGGYEKTYQSSVIFPNWKLKLKAKERWQVKLSLNIEELANRGIRKGVVNV